MCEVNEESHRIGYVVREALEHVHRAMAQQKILFVRFAWAKYLVIWMHSGPGYNAGINIGINGEWPCCLSRCKGSRLFSPWNSSTLAAWFFTAFIEFW